MFAIHETENSDLSLAIYKGRPVRTYDDGFGSLFVYGAEFGPSIVIRAMSWEDAYEIAIDESPAIPYSEVPEAYGFDNKEEFSAAIQDGHDLELTEGYQFQSNSTGTGIVFSGYYDWLTPIEDVPAHIGEKVIPIFTPH